MPKLCVSVYVCVMRWQALARRDTSALARAKTDVPLGLLKLDGVAKAVSLAEDNRQIAKARKEVLAAQQWMKQVHLMQAAQAPAKVLLLLLLLLPPACPAAHS